MTSTLRTLATFAVWSLAALPRGVAMDNALYSADLGRPLDGGWKWVREDAAAWRQSESELHIRPTTNLSLWQHHNNAKNLLLRQAPERDRFRAELDVSHTPTFIYEHAGLIAYWSDDDFVYVVKQFIDGAPHIVFTAENAGTSEVLCAVPYDRDSACVGLTIAAGEVAAAYRRPDETTWRELGTCKLPSKARALLGVVATRGPGGNSPWARFKSFRIVQSASDGARNGDAADARGAPDALRFTMESLDGSTIDLARYAGKVILIVNVASKCSLTPQYASLQALYEKYAGDGFVVLGVPNNDFGNQEPGTNESIATFARDKYGVTFPMCVKTSVTGASQCALYGYLTAGGGNQEYAGPLSWNFEKFIIGRGGSVVARFSPRMEPHSEEVVQAIRKALQAR